MATSIAPEGPTGPERIRGRVVLAALAAALLTAAPFVAATSAVAGGPPPLSAVISVGPKGEGAERAAEAMQALAKAPANRLPALLRAFDKAGPIGRNLIGGAVQVVAERAAEGENVADLLAETLTNDNLHPEAAALAFDLLKDADPARADRFLSERGLDSSAPPVRRAAVAARLNALGEDADAAALRALLARTLDRDQVETIADRLEEAGDPVDLPTHFGFLTDWQLVGPFDHRDGVGWDRTLPPETTPGEFDLNATFRTSFPDVGETVAWRPLTTDDDFGVLDVAESFENWKGSAVTLAREYVAAEAGPVAFRIGTPNAFKLYLNGKLLFARPEYHRGTRMDQYVIPAEVQAGRNVLMIKLLQNEQTQSWAQAYRVQIRVTDATGAALRESEPAPTE